MSNELKRIPLSLIRENPVALRAVNRGTEQYAEFAQSVAQKGVLNPIVVREIATPDGGQMYGIIEGLHRYTASLDAGFQDIPAQVINMTDAEVEEAQLIGNAHRIETKPVEYSKHLQRILASNPLLTIVQLANKLNKSSQWLSERLGMLKLNENIAKLVDSGRINLSNAYVMAKLPADEQDNFVDRAMTMAPTEFIPTVLARKKEIDTARRQGRETAPQEFIPVPHLQKLSDLKQEMESGTVGRILTNKFNVDTPAEGFALGVKWALHMDPASIQAAREKDEARRQKLREEKEKAAQDRARKKAEAAAKVAAETAQVS